MNISVAREVSADLAALFHRAVTHAGSVRGGPAMLWSLRGELDEASWLTQLVDTGSVWTAVKHDEVRGLAVARARVIEFVYVDQKWRRQKVATHLVKALLHTDEPPLDALALPGDRGTKSLYESLGWKARLLTMRGE